MKPLTLRSLLREWAALLAVLAIALGPLMLAKARARRCRIASPSPWASSIFRFAPRASRGRLAWAVGRRRLRPLLARRAVRPACRCGLAFAR